MKLQLPQSEQPRERFFSLGIEQLSNQELLALILRTGSSQRNVLELALDVLKHYPTLLDFKQTTLQELQQINGVGEVKALGVLATIELGKRLEQIETLSDMQITDVATVGRYLVKKMKDYRQEHLVALYLNTKNYLLRERVIFIGTLNESVAHPREIFHYAVRYSASKIIIAHNHPSGDVSPSPRDISFTKRLEQCGEMMGIQILDHLVIGKKEFLSFRQIGRLE